MITALLAGVLLLGCSEGPGDEDAARFVQREDSRLVKVQTVGLAAFGPINPHTAIPSHAAAAFGEPSSVDRHRRLCRHHWPALGLTIEFAAPSERDPCGTEARIEGIRVEGPAAVEAGWRTAEGIRPGMPVSAARRRYPDARRAGGGLILVEGPAEDESGEIVTVLSVTSKGARVEAMTFPIRAASG
ncbi:MAG: hypothetical protein ACRDL1_02040 [Solirubrobacterales bacterium]